MSDEFVDFDLEAAGLIRVILDEAQRGDLHPCSVATACLEVILMMGRRLPFTEREVLVELLGEQLDNFVIENYNEIV